MQAQAVVKNIFAAQDRAFPVTKPKLYNPKTYSESEKTAHEFGFEHQCIVAAHDAYATIALIPMLFTDAKFLFLFLPIALIAHRLALVTTKGKYTAAPRFVIFGLTLIFYGWNEPRWLIPFLICICFDFAWSQLLARSTHTRTRKLILVLSITQNLTLLSVFKYFQIFSIGLPPGISFYIFESLSFVIDVYMRRVEPPKRASEFFAFIGMFPRFIAGPIVRYRDMASQFRDYAGMKIEPGLAIFAVGLFFKCGFADHLAFYVPLAFAPKTDVDFVSAWVGAVAYSMQIYFDFYGYSLMAVGLGVCLGFQFPNNFNRPFLARDLQDFWRRWHISLSTWLRDYLYIPLGGNRKGTARTYANLFLTMLLGGIWHGANWTFVVWGAIHGGWLCLERAFLSSLPALLKRLLALLVVVLAFVFFRSDTVAQGFQIVTAMLNPLERLGHFNAAQLLLFPDAFAFSVAAILFCFLIEGRFDATRLERPVALTPFQWSAACLLVASTFPIGSPDLPQTPFLYFQF